MLTRRRRVAPRNAELLRVGDGAIDEVDLYLCSGNVQGGGLSLNHALNQCRRRWSRRSNDYALQIHFGVRTPANADLELVRSRLR